MAAKSLVDRCVVGDSQAWRDLYDEYHELVATFLNRMGVPASEADDVRQEVFVRVFRKLPSFEGRSDLRTWLYRVCVTQSGRLRRQTWFKDRLRWFRQTPAAQPQEPADFPTFGEEETDRRIAQALGRMKPQHRAVLVLYELEGRPGDEIARILECPVATVWSRLHYARREFKRLLEEDEVMT
jgi:RNA polymerase sigma-70 factor (ECF subfamily)